MKNLEQLKKTYKKLGEEIKEKELENPKIDFSKWMGRFNDTLAIKGDKHLKSFNNGGIGYSNGFKDSYTCDIHYEHTTLDKLVEGDVFIDKNRLDNICLDDFCIYISKNNDGNYITQYLDKNNGIEYIESNLIYGDTKVIKFLRH